MSASHQLDDETIEAFFAGRPLATGDIGSLVAFAEEVRLAAEGPVPVPSKALAAVLAEGFSPEKGDLPATAASNVTGPAPQAAGLPKRRSKRMIITELLAGLSIAAKAGLGVGIAAASVTGATVADVGPVRDAVEAVTPFNFDKANDKADFGERVSTDANGDEKGVDGKEISDEAQQRAADRRDSAPVPEDPASNGQKGLDKANDTPAAGRAPTSVPDGRATAEQRQPSVATERQPESTPTGAPASTPTGAPEGTPTGAPESTPTGAPESTPTGAPEGTPTGAPESTPTGAPEGTSGSPDSAPSGAPTGTPTGRP
ncbi:MAG: hypothetical protein M3P85_12980 [Actinomycetota bacterium]|nr:hypothetical protein [Actinomycetota bacterium]